MSLNFFTKFLSKNGIKRKGSFNIAQNIDILLSQRNLFDIEKCIEIDKNTLEQILQFQFTSNTKKPFFIIGKSSSASGKQKFQYRTKDSDGTIELILGADWYFLVNPNGTNHIIYTKDQKWIQFNKNKLVIEYDCIDGNAWGYGGGTFQADKFTSNTPVFITGILLDSIQEIFNKHYTH